MNYLCHFEGKKWFTVYKDRHRNIVKKESGFSVESVRNKNRRNTKN